jgi:hypothetical protein
MVCFMGDGEYMVWVGEMGRFSAEVPCIPYNLYSWRGGCHHRGHNELYLIFPYVNRAK